MFSVRAFLFLCLMTMVLSQDYYEDNPRYDDNMDQDYYAEQPDSMYHNYLEKKDGGGEAGKGGVLKTVAIAGASWFLGAKIHSSRAVKQANKKSGEATRSLYGKYLQDVSSLQAQNLELQQYISQMTATQLNEEFLQADYDNDREVSRAEFELYKKQYLARHPEMSEQQFPRFEDFDPNRDGSITMKEHTSYYQQEGHIL